jgi:hypothetical protein
MRFAFGLRGAGACFSSLEEGGRDAARFCITRAESENTAPGEISSFFDQLDMIVRKPACAVCRKSSRIEILKCAIDVHTRARLWQATKGPTRISQRIADGQHSLVLPFTDVFPPRSGRRDGRGANCSDCRVRCSVLHVAFHRRLLLPLFEPGATACIHQAVYPRIDSTDERSVQASLGHAAENVNAASSCAAWSHGIGGIDGNGQPGRPLPI